MEGLTVGSEVLYVLESGPFKGQDRPALVVRDWSSNTTPGSDGMVNLLVFTDGWNDGFKTAFPVFNDAKELVGAVSQIDLIVWRTSIHYSEAEEPGTWHWLKEEA